MKKLTEVITFESIFSFSSTCMSFESDLVGKDAAERTASCSALHEKCNGVMQIMFNAGRTSLEFRFLE